VRSLETPSEAFVNQRKRIFNTAGALTAAGCLAVSAFVFYALLW
jgi:hypothetical protein